MSNVGNTVKRDIDESESKPDLIKVTILLPQDTIDKIDSMSKVALLGSRGRTMQSLVDSVWESRGDISNILSNVKSFQKKTVRTTEETATLLILILFSLSSVTSRLNRFLGVS